MPLRRVVDRLYLDLPFARPGSAQAYLVALAVSAVAIALRLAIEPWVQGVPFITLFPAVAAVSLLCGARAGLASVLISGVAAWYFLMPPVFAFKGISSEDLLAVTLFFLVSSMIVALSGAMRLAIARYRELSATLEVKVEERTAELARARDDLAHAQKMEAIGHLTGGIAHDFNNMLAVMLGNLDLIKRRLAAGRTDIERNLDHAIDGANRAAEVTRRLLAFVRRQPLSPEVVDVNAVVRSVAELLRSTLGGGIEIECVLGGGVWPAHVDRSQLENSIVNLALNGRDAMGETGRLTLETANAYLDEEYAAASRDVVPGQYVLVAVSDAGCGMPPDVLERAFDPFFSTKDVGRGTGLGLSQTYGFVKQSKGHIKIYSEMGRGTTVKMYLPRHVGAGPRGRTGQDSVDQMPLGKASESILVVEDEAGVRATVVEALKEFGYQVLEASSGAEALEILRSQPPVTLLFTDVIMPGMNGRELAEQARAIRPDIKVLYTTGYTRNAIVHNGELDHDVALLQKPYPVEKLARAVRRALDE